VADTTVVTLAPGMGDAIQAAKAGILEVADVFCVNKADREGADRTVRELQEMQRLGEGGGVPGWTPPIQRTVAASGEGIEELADALASHWTWLREAGHREARMLDRARMQVRELALGAVRKRFITIDDGDLAEGLARKVAARELDPYAAADELLDSL
jgi:LAO/AO transport system kinase